MGIGQQNDPSSKPHALIGCDNTGATPKTYDAG